MPEHKKYLRRADGPTFLWTEQHARRPDMIEVDSPDEEVNPQAYDIRKAATDPEFAFLATPGMEELLRESLKKRKIAAKPNLSLKQLWTLFVKNAVPKNEKVHAQATANVPQAPTEEVINSMKTKEELQDFSAQNFGFGMDDQWPVEKMKEFLMEELATASK